MIQKENSHIRNQYDVVIIGGGISGLTSAALLTKAGLTCCLLEMDARPGGYLAGFDRGPFRFDSAIHWLNNCDENGWVGKVFKIIGNDFPKAFTQKRIRRFVSKEFDYLVTNEPDKLKNQWLLEFPEDKKGIIQFFKDAKKISKSFENYLNLSRTMDTMGIPEKITYGLKMLKFALPFIPHVKYNGDKKVQQRLKKYFSNEKLRNVFSAEPDILSCLIPIAWAYSNNFQTPPKGGSQSYPEWLLHSSSSMGADIFLRTKAIKINTIDNKATSVKLIQKKLEKEIQARFFVIASDTSSLYEKLLPKTKSGDLIIKNLKQAQLYSSAVTVSIGLNCTAESLGLGEENIYLADTLLSRAELSKGGPLKSGMHIIASSVRDPSLAPSSKGTLTLFIPAELEDNNYWNCERADDGSFIRGAAYKKLKDEYAQILFDRIEEHLIPNFRNYIQLYDISTPMTLLRYTGNKNGSMMGQKPGKKNMQSKVASYKTPYQNVYQSGHWADLGGGILIAMKSAVNTSLMILKKEKPKHFKILAKYMDGKIDIHKLHSSETWKEYNNDWVQKKTPAERRTSLEK